MSGEVIQFELNVCQQAGDTLHIDRATSAALYIDAVVTDTRYIDRATTFEADL